MPFFLLMVLLGVLLIFGPEFFYLRDQFGWRINTIFKFYYQAWLLLGIAVAYAIADLLRQAVRPSRLVLEIGVVALLAVGLVSWLTFQALINIGGVAVVLPITGVPLPFVSSGGSALLANMAAAGVLVNIARVSARGEGATS